MRILTLFCILFAAAGCERRDDGFGNISTKTPPREIPPQQRELIEFVNRSIQAHGGESNIQRLGTATRVEVKGNGAFAPGIDADFRFVDVFQFPGKFRRHIWGEFKGESTELIFVSNGKAVWMKTETGAVVEMPSAGTQVDSVVYTPLRGLLELKRGDYQLRKDAAVKPGEFGIALSKLDGDHGTVVFGKDTHLIQSSIKPTPDIEADKWVTMSTDYGEYEKHYGVVVPTRIVMRKDGELLSDMKITKIELLEVVDESLFEEPK